MRIIAAAIAVVVLSGACGDDHQPDDAGDPTSDDPAPDPTAGPAAEPTEFAVDADGTPSPTAVATDRTFRDVREGLLDCGTVVTTSGWPTTTVPNPLAATCIVDAAAEGRPAQYSVAARDFAGGMEGTVFVVNGPGSIVAIDYDVDPDGLLSTGNRQCRALTASTTGPEPTCTLA